MAISLNSHSFASKSFSFIYLSYHENGSPSHRVAVHFQIFMTQIRIIDFLFDKFDSRSFKLFVDENAFAFDKFFHTLRSSQLNEDVNEGFCLKTSKNSKVTIGVREKWCKYEFDRKGRRINK